MKMTRCRQAKEFSISEPQQAPDGAGTTHRGVSRVPLAGSLDDVESFSRSPLGQLTGITWWYAYGMVGERSDDLPLTSTSSAVGLILTDQVKQEEVLAEEFAEEGEEELGRRCWVAWSWATFLDEAVELVWSMGSLGLAFGMKEEAQEEDPEIDLEAIAQKAVDHALTVSKRQQLGQELKCLVVADVELDVGLGADDLYLSGVVAGHAVQMVRGKANGERRAEAKKEREEKLEKCVIPAYFGDMHAHRRFHHKALGIRRIDAAKLENLGSDGLADALAPLVVRHKMTPELEKELRALRLRANFDPKRPRRAEGTGLCRRVVGTQGVIGPIGGALPF
eukprot:Skav221266  [mRNA]  locus=scaffold1935:35542:43201:- [translate_table: standard]